MEGANSRSLLVDDQPAPGLVTYVLLLPGWTEKGNGPSMTNAGIGTGLMRTAYGK